MNTRSRIVTSDIIIARSKGAWNMDDTHMVTCYTFVQIFHFRIFHLF